MYDNPYCGCSGVVILSSCIQFQSPNSGLVHYRNANGWANHKIHSWCMTEVGGLYSDLCMMVISMYDGYIYVQCLVWAYGSCLYMSNVSHYEMAEYGIYI